MANGKVREYIGARYVPKFADPVEWDIDSTYEPLMMVQYQGETYMTKQYVPADIPLPNVGSGQESNDYWVHMSNWNAQVEGYREEVLRYADEVQTFDSRIDTLEDDLPTSSFDSTNTVAAAINALGDVLPASSFDSTNTIAAAISDLGDILPTTSFDSTNTIAAAIAEEETERIAQDDIRAITFETVADMKASTDLKNGMLCKTSGFYSINDGGGAWYKISNSGTANEMDVIACGSLYASYIQNEEFVHVKQLGLKETDTGIAGLDKIRYVVENYNKIDFDNLEFRVAIDENEGYDENVITIAETKHIKNGSIFINSVASIWYDLFMVDNVYANITIEDFKFESVADQSSRMFYPNSNTLTSNVQAIHANRSNNIVMRNVEFYNIESCCKNDTIGDFHYFENCKFLNCCSGLLGGCLDMYVINCTFTQDKLANSLNHCIYCHNEDRGDHTLNLRVKGCEFDGASYPIHTYGAATAVINTYIFDTIVKSAERCIAISGANSECYIMNCILQGANGISNENGVKKSYIMNTIMRCVESPSNPRVAIFNNAAFHNCIFEECVPYLNGTPVKLYGCDIKLNATTYAIYEGSSVHVDAEFYNCKLVKTGSDAFMSIRSADGNSNVKFFGCYIMTNGTFMYNSGYNGAIEMTHCTLHLDGSVGMPSGWVAANNMCVTFTP